MVAATSPPPGSLESLLFIDDEANILSSLRRLFRPLGYRILTAKSGADGLRWMEKTSVDLVICDMRMPEMTGVEVLEQIRLRWPGVVRILLTGYSDIKSTIAAINRSEIRRYISKPWNNHQLILVVREALDNKRLLTEKLRLEALTQRQNEEIKGLYEQVLTAKKVTERLLLNVLPSVIVDRLKERDSSIISMQQTGEELFPPLIADAFPDVTVLFADIVSFTHIAAQVPPRKLVFLLNEIFTDFDTVMDAHGLEKIKTIGDSYMAVAGVPTPLDGHATCAALAALDMMSALSKFNLRNRYALQMRIGLHSGSVVAGVIGKHKFIYDLWGDTVNVASRMESHSVAGRIQLSDTTRRQLADDFHCEDRGEITVKGLDHPIHAWFLNGREAR